jgi:hypothetical protein
MHIVLSNALTRGWHKRMLEIATRFSLLAFGTPGFAPDEHLSGTQPNHWSRHEPHQAKRCEEPPVSALPHENTSVRPRKPARCNRLLRARTGRNQANPSNFAKDFVAEHSSSGVAVAPPIRCPVPSALHGARGIQKRASLKPHSVFLRKECILPDRLDPLQEPCGEHWTLVKRSRRRFSTP